jgi:hypothetical protein
MRDENRTTTGRERRPRTAGAAGAALEMRPRSVGRSVASMTRESQSMLIYGFDRSDVLNVLKALNWVRRARFVQRYLSRTVDTDLTRDELLV